MSTTKNPRLALPSLLLDRLRDPALREIGRKLAGGGQVEPGEGVACLESTDLCGLGQLALAVKRVRFGDRAFFIANHHLNYTNICGNGCRFCAFHRPAGSADGYAMSPDEAARRIAESPVADLREVHLVGGCNPELDFPYCLDLLRAILRARPGVKLKAFTAVEIAQMAKKAGLSHHECLVRLKEAGLVAMPGGGAEVFSERIRQRLFPHKIGADEWLSIHATAHRLGITSNATLLFGHIETPAERVEHLIRLREQQEESGGFQAFIALPFHPANTPLKDLPGPTGVDILKTIATARLLLDNIPHIKAYWVMLGPRLTQTALHFGADDLEGTIVHERIAHEAGARTKAGLTVAELLELIREAGFEPVQRNTFHQALE
ncbi:MAG TPA: aminofutalosine synthase MqnE [Syntrophobacteria bacterium]|nr:aminofutalosine synthase MqnE [Syntrophobacteria bacterium]